MRKHLDHLLHKDRVHLTAFYGIFIALALLGLDFTLVGVVQAPTLPAAIIWSTIPVPSTQIIDPVSPPLHDNNYIEVIDSCGPYYNGGPCVNMRSGPDEEYPVVLKLRTGIVLEVSATVTDKTGRSWYKIKPDHKVRYPERITSDWYVASNLVQFFYDDGAHELSSRNATTTKHIIVSRSKQTLTAYDGDILYMEILISTGLELTPTPLGTYKVYRMTPSRYMQGPIPGLSDQPYDLPGVPWNLYFTVDGAVIHGVYWHDHFGQPWSHGCVNVPLDKAKELYMWADMGTTVTVQD